MLTSSKLALAGLLLAGCGAPPPRYSGRLTDWEQTNNERMESQDSEAALLVEGAGLTEILRHARAHNPGLEAALQRWKAALEKVPGATTLANPRVTLGGFLSEVETRVGPMQARVGVAQPLPWFGKLRLAGEVQFAAAEEARELLEAALLELDQRARAAWYEYAWLERAIVITGGNRDLLIHWESVARARLSSGLGSYADVIRAQVELGKLEDRAQSLNDLRGPIVASLNAALNRPSASALPRPTGPLPDPPSINGEQLAASLHQTNPILRALGHRIEGARQGVELASKAFYPDFAVGVDYTLIGSAKASGVSGSGDDAFALTLGVELPIWRQSYRAGVRGAEARTRAAQAEQVEATNRLKSELEMTLYQFRDAGRRVVLFRDSLIPKGEEVIQTLDAGYQAGDESFLSLIDAQRVLLEFQLQAARAESDRMMALAMTERIIGTPLQQER
ncbi:MAG: cobalt-zinc-cadmium efflux system outer membrane protein [Planctomycetota bacterium]|jgi:cobalt-zinc-cadmium efflux system outer membrane protein